MTPNYARRREQFYQQLAQAVSPRAAAIVPGAREVRRNGDNPYPFRQSSDLWFLTGFPEPDALAIFTPAKQARFTLLVQPRDARHEIYYGKSAGVDGAVSRYGADQAFPRAELSRRLLELLGDCDDVVLFLGEDPELDVEVARAIGALRRGERRGPRAPRRIVDLSLVLHELRLIKDAFGLDALRRAAAVTAAAHRRAAAAARPGRREFEIAAEIEHTFRVHGGAPGYGTIVAAGENATTLHYPAGGAALGPGAMLLIDAGCEIDGFTADVTRTYPIPAADGQVGFAPAQRQLYELVLRAQQAGIELAQPGQTLDAIHSRCTEILTAGLVDLGLLGGDVAALIQKGEQRKFAPHLTSHWLGMDVHDVGDYGPIGSPRALAPGMVLTVEPGLYIRASAEVPEEYRGLGVRIEDDVLITADGPEVLTAAIPKDLVEVEDLVREVQGAGRTG